MKDRDESVWLTKRVEHRDASTIDCAANRVEQLVSLREKLAAGEGVDERDVALANHCAEEAQIRARRAHLAAAEQYRRTAQAHERAAYAHDAFAAQGIGDVEAHRRAAVAHRSDNDYRAADKAFQLAESVRTPPGTSSEINSSGQLQQPQQDGVVYRG
jgi:hypothetical protein